MPTIGTRACDLVYDELGSGPALVLLHNAAHSRRDWDGIRPARRSPAMPERCRPPRQLARCAGLTTRAAVLGAVAVGLAACTGSVPTDKAPAGLGGGPSNAGIAEPTGIAAASLTCDTFSTADLAAAVRQVVPSATVAPDRARLGGQGDCLFAVYTPGTDTRSTNAGELGVLIMVQDSAPLPDTSLDTAMRSPQRRARIAETIARAALTSLG